MDSVLLLAVLLVADGAASPLIIGYPLLIVGSGLWFRVRFVSFMAVLSLLSYGVLIFDCHTRRQELSERYGIDVDDHVIFIVALVIMALIVGYLVRRLRILRRFCGQE